VSGTGPQQLTWTPADGDWTVVVMNADGSAGVSVEASIGATVPALRGLAWGVLIAGVFLTVVGLLVVALAVRRRPVAPSYGYPGQVPPGPAAGGTPPPGPASTGTLPPWVPPVPTDRTTAADARPGSESSTPRDPRSG
jgi:hypothetical protein